jgi:hypothetical protein
VENPFKQLLYNEALPELIKGKVMEDVNLIKLGLDLADLFVVKNPQTIKESLKKPKK